MVRQRMRIGVFFFVLLFFLISRTSWASSRVKITVFVHGTILPGLMLVSPHTLFQADISDEAAYARLVHRVRDHADLFEASPILGLGLTEILPMDIAAVRNHTLELPKARSAAYFVVSGYDAVARASSIGDMDYRYALFGWSGMISQRERKDAGYALYDYVCELYKRYRKNYTHVQINLVAYSHGGNVALWLADAEAHKQKKLLIDTLVLLGTPIQQETAGFIGSPVFSSIFSLYSDGDTVQTIDSVSTKLSMSFARMGNLANLSGVMRKYAACKRSDVRLLVNGVSGLGHEELFQMTRQAVHPTSGTLPLVVFIPAIIAQVMDYRCVHFDAHIDLTEKQVLIHVASDGAFPCLKRADIPRGNLYSVVTAAQRAAERWGGKEVGMLSQTLQAFKYARQT